MTFLALDGYHAFVTGARGGIGSAIVRELLGKSFMNPYAPLKNLGSNN